MSFWWLEVAAHLAAIATAIVAVWAYGRYAWVRRDKRIRLEQYLRFEKQTSSDQGMRTVLHLVAELGMTESEVVDAAFRSEHIIRRVSPDMMGAASKLLLEYSEPKVKDRDYVKKT